MPSSYNRYWRRDLFVLALLFLGLSAPVVAQTVFIRASADRVDVQVVEGPQARLSARIIRDVNHDGEPDFLVARGREGSFAQQYVIFGRADGQYPQVDLARLKPDQGIRLPGIPVGSDQLQQQGASKTSFSKRAVATTAASSIGLVSDINEMPAGILPHAVVEYQQELYFTAGDPDTGTELYRLNGTTPELVADVLPGPSSSMPSQLTVFGDLLVFAAFEPATGRELYVYDGSKTVRLTDIATGPDYSIDYWWYFGMETNFVELNGKLYFLANVGETTGLYSYDGTTVSPVNNPITGTHLTNVTRIMAHNGTLLVFWTDGALGTEQLYAYTPTGLTLLSALSSSYYFGLINGSAVLDGKLIFSATADQYVTGLFQYDGTVVTPIELTYNEQEVSNPMGVVVFNGKLYFNASTEATGYELFAYDGTTVTLVQEIVPGEEDTYPYFLVASGGRLFFFVYESNSEGYGTLYVYDGTTVKKWSEVSSATFYPFALFPIGSMLYVSAYEEATGYQLWKIEGTTTTRVTSKIDGTIASSPEALTAIGTKLYFGAYQSGTSSELYQFDGTNITMLADIGAELGESMVEQIVEFDGKIVFRTYNWDTGLYNLYVNNAGTVSLVAGDVGEGLATYNGKLYFGLYDETGAQYLHVYDGTAVALAPNSDDEDPDSPEDLFVFNGKLYFSAYGSAGTELYSYDGTSTTLVADLDPMSGSFPHSFVAYENKLYFIADPASGDRLFVYDGSNTTELTAAGEIECDWEETCLVQSEGKFYYRGTTAEDKSELFQFDGTTATQLTTGGEAWGTDPGYLTVFNGKILFAGDHAAMGRELFVYDGTEAGVVADLWAGYDGSHPEYLTVFNGKLYFAADHPAYGTELFSISASGTVGSEGPGENSGFALGQNYPNPAAYQTRVSFTLPQASPVRLSLYDMLGRRVAVVADGSYAAGTHEVELGVGGMQNGTYFLRLEAGGRTFVRKVTVAR